MNTVIITSAVTSIIEAIEPNVTRPATAGTPGDFATACLSWFNGYDLDPQARLDQGRVPNSGSDYNHIVVRRNIPFFSFNESTFVPFFGHVTVAYVPAGSLLSPASLDAVVKGYASRLTSPAMLAANIADAVATHGLVAGSGVIVTSFSADATNNIDVTTTTSKLRGLLEQDAGLRCEFFHLSSN